MTEVSSAHRWSATRRSPGEVRVRRALLSVSDKTRDRRLRARAGRARRRARLHRRHRRASSTEAGLEVRSIEDFTGFPEIMDGRVKTLHPKLYAGLLARARRRRAPARRRASTDVEFVDLVCVNLYPFERTAARRGVDRRRGDREHRHRRPDDDPRGGQEPRRSRRSSSRPRATTRCSRSCARRERRLSLATRESLAARGVRLHRALRHRDRALVRREARSDFPPLLRARLREGHRPLLRREPAPARGLLRRRSARACTCCRWCASSAARSCRSTTCSTSTPRRLLVRRVRGPGVRDHQAQQPVRRARVGETALEAYRARVRVRPAVAPSAASSASTARSTARSPRRSSSSSSRCCSRPATTTTRSRCSRASRTCACSRTTSGARSTVAERELKRVHGRPARAGPRHRTSRTRDGDGGRHRAQADRGRVGRAAVRLEGLQARALQRDRAGQRPAPRSASARAR